MKHLILILLLTACGSDHSSSGGSQTAAVASTPAPLTTSYYVASSSALVACNVSSKGFLAYVQDKAQFMACLDAGWTAVNVNGNNGKDGSNGSNGVNGSNGKDGTMVSGNQWYDAITSKMWVMTTITTSTVGWVNSMTACGGGYRMPSPSEVNIALTHGMKACAQALTNAPTQIIANDGQTYNVSNAALNNVGSGAQFCIAN